MKNVAEGVFIIAVTKETELSHEEFDAKYDEMEFEVEVWIKHPDGSKEKFDTAMHGFKLEAFMEDE